MFQKNCMACDTTELKEKRSYIDFNNCTKFECVKERVQLRKTLNKHCLTSYEVFSLMAIRFYKPLLYVSLLLMAAMLAATLDRKFQILQRFKKKKRTNIRNDIGIVIENAHCVFAFQGTNLPSDQWFLEMELSKDFNNTIISRSDYGNLTREVNQLCKWKKKSLWMYSLAQNFFPICTSHYLRKGRKAVYKSLQTYVESKNEQLKKDKQYSLQLWSDESFAVAQLIVISSSQPFSDVQPFIVQLSGSMELDDPMCIHLNPSVLSTHLWLYFDKDLEKVKPAMVEIRKKLFKLNGLFSRLYLHDNSIYFCFKMIEILKTIDEINGNVFGIKINFVILEQLKVKYQKLKYR
jgi:hypothetical protein